MYLYVSSGMELGLPTMRRSKIMKMVKNPTYRARNKSLILRGHFVQLY